MNGLLRRLTRRAATADESPPRTPAASEPVDATAVHPAPEGGDAPLSEQDDARIRRRRDIPAGVDPDRLESPAAEGARPGRLRKRIRFLRHAREVLLRDLGGFYYELHRSAGSAQHGGHRDILETKAGRLAAIDHELRALEERLRVTGTPETVVREPGVGGTCSNCGELHASDAHWCAHCGTPLTDRARRRQQQETDAAIASRQTEANERARAAEQARGPSAGGNGATTGHEDGATAHSTTARGDAPTTELPADTIAERSR